MTIIVVATIIYFDHQNNKYHLERLERKEKTITSSLQYFFKDLKPEETIDFVTKDFDYKIKEIADVNSLEIRVYNLNGELLIYTDIFNEDVDDKFSLDEKTLHSLNTQPNKKVVKDLGNGIINTFSYAKNKKGENMIIINIPYDSKGQKAQNEVMDFLMTLIKIFIILFIIGGLVSYLLSNYITKSLQKIVLKIKGVQLNQLDEALNWDKDDEIGVLVDAYNSMIEKLKVSTEKLAKSERQSAWREMAKQVAHEIKNPLTPMKLSVQHLERSLAKDPENSTEKIQDFKTKMIQQIDLLSNIANEFSNFAELPKANFKELDLLKMVNSIVDLFENKSCTISIDYQKKTDYTCFADEHQLIRVFNNLIQNSIQSFTKEGDINILLSVKGGFINIVFKDNGEGISKENITKIFEPNFTTKSNGKGLGLAMVDQIVKSHSGSIELLSSSKQGTSFLITLPLKIVNE
ncbi:MAG: ATP-binding protein [Flavobacteriales bacterium]|nr:ATP-binding protein [Flavobacteriales bacterium]